MPFCTYLYNSFLQGLISFVYLGKFSSFMAFWLSMLINNIRSFILYQVFVLFDFKFFSSLIEIRFLKMINYYLFIKIPWTKTLRLY